MVALNTRPESAFEMDRYAGAFERAWQSEGTPSVTEFLPPREHPLYEPTLGELIRIDLEMRWTRGQPKRLLEYCAEFPVPFRNAVLLRDIAFEEYRQRLQAGDQPDRAQYESEYGLDVAAWPLPTEQASEPNPPTRVLATDQIDRELAKISQEYADIVEDLRQSKPLVAEQLKKAVDSMPICGQRLFGFDLIKELGEGSFAKVFLAHQTELADRPVALKVSPSLQEEPRTLARLQHTNIVPIYSVHQTNGLQAVCMPYLGSLTLSNVVKDLTQNRGTFPESGRHLLSTLFGRYPTLMESKKRKATGSAKSTDPEPSTDSGIAAAELFAPILHMMSNFNHVQAVLWIGARLADGLAHAHERGILHLDLKPANILLTDEGQPMLLDFNLAVDLNGPISVAAAVMGGTLPYMSPEQLEAFRGGKRAIDGRCDLFALGVILFELLTGQLPFTIRRGRMGQVVSAMIAERTKGPPSPAAINTAISPAVDALIRKLLEPDPSRRYQSAANLREDAERQLANRPLKFAPDRSPGERLRKWRRRHRSLATACLVGLVACVFLLLPATVVAIRQNQIAERKLQVETAEAQLAAGEFGREARTVQALLATRGNRDLLNRGIERGKVVLDRYGIGHDPAWMQQPLFTRLPPDRQNQLRADLGEMLLLMDRGEQLRAGDAADASGRLEALRKALEWNRLAEACYPDGKIPALLARHRAQLLAALPEESRSSSARELSTTGDDAYHEALAYVLAGRYRDALTSLLLFTDANPRNFQAWFLRGHCHDILTQWADSATCWAVCTALEPDMPWTWFNRGIVRMQQRDHRGAESDFTKALDLQSDWLEAKMNRAIARKARQNYAGALEDMNEVIDREGAPVRAWFIRAEIKDLSGKKEAAQRDRVEGMKREPNDELSWSTRGYARMTSEPKEALKDVEQALALNPSSRKALINKSIILSEFLNRPEEAVAVLDRFLKWYPDNVGARAGRGVVLARIGECDKARRDAKECLLQERTPFLQFQLAGLYAQISRHEKGNDAKDEAQRLLGNALRSGFTDLQTWKADHDLDPLRGEAEFKRLQGVLAGLKLSPVK